jgi:hypothetical protein
MLACWREDPGSWWFNAPRPELVLMRSWCCWYRKRRLSSMSRVQGLLNCNPIPYSLTWPDLQNCDSQRAILHSALLEIPTPTWNRKSTTGTRNSIITLRTLQLCCTRSRAIRPFRQWNICDWTFPSFKLSKRKGVVGEKTKFSQKPSKNETTRKVHALIGYALIIKWIWRKQDRL